MTRIRFFRSAERVFEQIFGPPGRIAVAHDAWAPESRSFGASVAVMEDHELEWTVLYDEYIYLLEGEVSVVTREGSFVLQPGDGLWLPEGTWTIYRARWARALVVVYPVNRREIHGFAESTTT